MKKFLKRYKFFLVILVINIIICFVFPEIGKSSVKMSAANFKQVFSVIPPIFLLLGLLDVWVDKETMMKYLGKGSGLKGIAISFFLGAAAAGPLYAAFPIAAVMLKKGCGLFQVFIFIGAWSTAKIPMLTYEATSLGITFALTRLIMNIFGIMAIALIVEKSLSKEQKEEIYKLSENNDK